MQWDELVASYLDCCAQDSGDGMPTTAPSLLTGASPSSSGATVEVINLFCKYFGFPSYYMLICISVHKTVPFPSVAGCSFSNEALLCHGFLGSAPLYPTLMISLRTLAAYCQMHHVAPWFSIQAQCKALCHMHNVCNFLSLLIIF